MFTLDELLLLHGVEFQERHECSHGDYAHQRAIGLGITVEISDFFEYVLHQARIQLALLDVCLAISEVTNCRRTCVSNIKGIVADPSDVLKSYVLDELGFLGLNIIFLVELKQSLEKMICQLIVIRVLSWQNGAESSSAWHLHY